MSSWPTTREWSSTVTSKLDLLEGLKDAEYRQGFVESHVYTGIAFQMRSLREKREAMTQAQLGKLAKMAQERISILEDPNAATKPTINTLLRIANALGVGLHVRFAPFSQLIREAVETDEDALDVPSFDDEADEIRSGLETDLLVHATTITPMTQSVLAKQQYNVVNIDTSREWHKIPSLFTGDMVFVQQDDNPTIPRMRQALDQCLTSSRTGRTA